MSPRNPALKPPRLQKGDTVAAISLSSGLAHMFPHRYRAGKEQFEKTFSVTVIETPNALKSDDWLYRHPEARADDLHWALANREIKAIVSTIGGDDSVRILPYVDESLIARHPKILLGFSDATITHTAFARAGVVSFHGPALMTDIAENGGIHLFVSDSLRRVLFDGSPHELAAAPEWTEELLDWSVPELQLRQRTFQPNEGWLWLQGNEPAEGHLVGGCADVLEFLKGTRWWPDQDLWKGAVLVLETSEDAPSPEMVGWWLRNYGMQGILTELNGLLLARPRDYTANQRDRLHESVRSVLEEFDRQDLPVVANMDLGHTSPQLTLPLGCRVRLDPHEGTVHITESCVV